MTTSQVRTRTCRCGHSQANHLGGRGRCDEPSKRCRCSTFRECTHPNTRSWRGRAQCTECGRILANRTPHE